MVNVTKAINRKTKAKKIFLMFIKHILYARKHLGSFTCTI